MKLLIILGLLLVDALAQNNPTHRKFEYKHSFRAPNLAQRDGSIPFWTVQGDAIASSEQLRLAPSMRSRKGIAFNKRPMVESEHWELEMAFKVTGQGRIGADGIGIWYTAQQGALGPVFGSNDYWVGMGLFLDSFDNDGQKNNPFVALMINDGTRAYDHVTDGSQQVLTGCQKDFRNKPFPVRIRIEYFRNVITVYMTDGLTQANRYELCLRAENIFLPRNGYFGVSAATGGLADDHDVLDFSVYSLFTDAQPRPADAIPQDERQKYDAEFQRQMQDFEEERKKFKEAHPDKAKEDDEDLAKYYEDATVRELRLIYEAQTGIHQVLQNMETRLREIGQQQALHTTYLQSGQGAVQQPQAGGGQPVAAAPGGKFSFLCIISAFQQHEKNEVMQNLRDIKNYVNEIYTRTYNMEQKINQGGGAVHGQVHGSGGAQVDQTVRTYLDSIQNDVRNIRSSLLNNANVGGGAAAGGCPNISCISPMLFMVVVALQSGIIIVFVFLRSKSDKAKFY